MPPRSLRGGPFEFRGPGKHSGPTTSARLAQDTTRAADRPHVRTRRARPPVAHRGHPTELRRVAGGANGDAGGRPGGPQARADVVAHPAGRGRREGHRAVRGGPHLATVRRRKQTQRRAGRPSTMLQPIWRRRRRTPTGDERSAADHIDLLSIARTVVQEVRAQPNDPHGGDLEDIEVVHVLHGQDMDQAREPGILMTWHQGQNVFGLLTPMGRLIHQAGGVESRCTSDWRSTNRTVPHRTVRGSGFSTSRRDLTDRSPPTSGHIRGTGGLWPP